MVLNLKKGFSLLMVLSMLAAAVFTSLSFSTAAEAAAGKGYTTINDGIYKINPRQTSLYYSPGNADMSLAPIVSGESTVIYEQFTTGSDREHWNFKRVGTYEGSGVYTIQNVSTGQEMNVEGDKYFLLVDLGNGYYNIEAFYSALNLDLERKDGEVFKELVKYTPYNNDISQQFKLIPVQNN